MDMSYREQLQEVLAELEAHSLHYCILRNYTFLLEGKDPRKPSETSIDMVIPKEQLSQFTKLLHKLGFQKRNKFYSKSHVPFFRIHNGIRLSFDVQVGGIHWNDICYLPASLLFKNRVKKSFFWVPSDNDTFTMLLIHSVVGKRRFKPEYKELLQTLTPKIDKTYVLSLLQNTFPKKMARRLFHHAITGKFSTIIQNKQSYIRAFILQSPRTISTFTLLTFRWLRWKRFLKPYPLISILGPDGSGKSTLVSNLQFYLQNQGRTSRVVYTGRGRNHILPMTKLGKMYKRKEKKRDSHSQKKPHWKRKVLYTCVAPLFTMDVLLRYYLTILPQRMKGIVITDRYCSDIMLMQHVPVPFKRFLLALFPKPTVSLLLYNSPETLHARRPEESVKELQRQLDLFRLQRHTLRVKTEHPRDSDNAIQSIFTSLVKNWY